MPPEPIALTDTTTDQQPKPAPAGDRGVSDQQQKPVKPDGFPEALSPYWNDDRGTDFAKMGEDFAAFSTLKAENDARLAQVPENVEEYEVALPEGFEIPDGVSFEALKDHPLVADARAFAKENGLTRDQFKALIGLEARRQIAEHKQLVEASTAERNKLGTKATQRIEAVAAWAQAILGNELSGAIMPMMFTAKQVEAFEKLMTVAKAGGPKLTAISRSTDQPPEVTEEEWSKLSPTQRIQKGRELDARKTG